MKKICIVGIAFAVALVLLTGCLKPRHPSPGRIARENPFTEYIQDLNNKVNLTVYKNDAPIEIGYSFTASDTGTIYEIGTRLPDTGKVHTVSLWDGITQALLIQKNIKINGSTGFNYVDLNSTNEGVNILANHPYVVSVNLVPYNSGLRAGSDYFIASRTDLAPIFPLTDRYITFQHQYNRTTTTPAFPSNQIMTPNFIGGLCDIGFSHITK